jgi:hypothetical protein
MRHICAILSVSLTIFFSFSIHAQIPNNGFENWLVDGNDNNPVDWSTTNNYPLVSVTPYTPAYAGEVSMRVSTFEAINMTFGGAASIEFPYSDRPKALNACVKTTVMPGDKVLLIISFYQGDSIIALPTDCTFSIDTTLTDFTCLSFPVTYQSNLVPDSAIIIVMAGSDSPQPGTEIIIDELFFTLATRIEQKDSFDSGNSHNYPNPAGNITYIPLDLFYESDVEVIIWDINGKVVQSYPFHSLSVGNHELNINTSQLSNGIYPYSVRGKDFIFHNKMLISK